MSNIKQIAATGAADGTVELAEFPYNPLSCQIHTLRYFNAQGDDITGTITQGSARFQFNSSIPADEQWRDFDIAQVKVAGSGDNTSPKVTSSLVRQVRAIFSGFPAGTTFKIVSMAHYFPSPEMDSRVFTGEQGLVTQGFSEANSKNGSQFEFTARITNLVSITPQYIGFETGDKPVIVKQRDIFGGFINADFDVFKGSEYTGGSPGIYSNNNDLVDNSGGVTISIAPNVSSEGLPFGVTTPLLGSEGVGGRILSTFGDAAGEKILAPNTKYLAKFTNLSTAAIGVIGFRLYWYEGFLSTQL